MACWCVVMLGAWRACMQQHQLLLLGVAVDAAPPTAPPAAAAAATSQRAPQAFYNGFMPNFARLGTWNVAMFLVLEQVRALSCFAALRACASC